MIKYILWDLDGTLLDFLYSERVSLSECLSGIGIEPTDELIGRYSAINDSWWKKYEKGLVDKDTLLFERFRDFFEQENLICPDIPAFQRKYENGLSECCRFLDDAPEVLKKLKAVQSLCGQYIVTNGASKVQRKKLALSGLDQLCDGVFISEEIGAPKPSKEFYMPVLECIKDAGSDEILIVGDSLTSDISGGNNVGIRTCWYNPEGKENIYGVHIDAEIRNLHEVVRIVLESE